MTTGTQPQTQQEQPDDSNVWRILGRLEANQQAILHRIDQQDARMDRLESKMDRLLYAMIAVTIANAGTIVAVIAT